MSLISPLSLLLLIPVAGIIVLLYLLKLKRREQMVSSVMLWQDAVADIQANAPFQKLKKNLLLLLQLLIAISLILAVARPYMRAKGISDNRIVVIIDSSASMQASDVSGSRFDAAKSQALDIVNRMGHGDTMLVVAAGEKSRVAAPFTSDKRVLGQAISDLRPGDAGCNMRRAMLLALSLVGQNNSAATRIVVLSDGGFPELTDLSASNARIDFVRLGRQSDNVAITGLSSRRTLAGEQQVFVGLRNFSGKERKFNLELYLNDKLLDIREETLAPNASREEILSGIDGLSGRITAKVDIRDDLSLDNSGSVYLAKPGRISALLVSKGNLFLQNALNLDPRVELAAIDTVAGLTDGEYDLVIFDGVAPPASLPRGGYLLVGTSCAQGPAEAGASVERPSIIGSAKNHPVTAYVDFSGVAISKAAELRPREWASGIVEGEHGLVGVAGDRNGRRFVQISFDLLESDFPLRVGFPIFVANCIDWLSPRSAGSTGESIRTGQPIYIDVPAGLSEITVENPDGRKETIEVTRTPVVFDDTERAGIYQVRGKDFRWEFACNLCSSEESNTAPRTAVLIGDQKLSAGAGAVSTNRELYGFLVILALGVLMVEWYAYHRRL